MVYNMKCKRVVIKIDLFYNFLLFTKLNFKIANCNCSSAKIIILIIYLFVTIKKIEIFDPGYTFFTKTDLKIFKI